MLATLYNRILIVLAFAGIFVSGVLSAGEFYAKDVPCGPSHGCLLVARHPSSHMLGGIPNAYLGLLAYLALAVIAVTREWTGPKKAPELTQISLLVTGIGSLFSLFLTYISITQIKATCPWCLTSLGIILLSTVLNYLLLRAIKSVPESAPEPARTPGIWLAAACALLSFSAVGWEAADFSGKAGGVITLSDISDANMQLMIGPGVHVQNPNGVVTIVEFGDLVCPTCKSIFPAMEDFVGKSNGKVKLIFHHNPLYQLPEHVYALPGAALSELCAEKGKFWQFVTACYSGDQGAPEPDLDAMLVFAKSLGVDPVTARNRITDPTDPAFKKVQADLDLASALGIHSTPTFILIAPGEKPQAVVGGKVFDVLQEPKYKNALK